MKKLCAVIAFLSGFLATNAAAQAVTVTWPLTQSTMGTSAQPSLVTASPEVVMGGPAPAIQVFDYWSGQAQRLWSGTTGWFAGSVNSGRFIQFDAAPTPGNQLLITSVSFNYGGAGINGHVRSEVRYSVDNWSTSTILSSSGPLAYPQPAMLAFTKAFAAPSVTGSGKFSLRIYPYAVLNSVAASPTFASHNNVVINGRSEAVAGGKTVRFDIRKVTGDKPVAGTYLFTVTCFGSGGPYTGVNPVAVVLPSPGVSSVSVPAGSICGVKETAPAGNWSAPIFDGSGIAVSMGAPWEAKVGPITANGGVVKVTNLPGKPGEMVRFNIRKVTGALPIAGNYFFNVTCNAPDGTTYSPVPNPVAVVLPGPGVSTVSVPAGSICNVTETQPTGTWDAPGFTATGVALLMGAPWEAKVGPVAANGGVVTVANRPKEVAAGACPAYTFTASLNVGAMIPTTVGAVLNHQTNNGAVEKYCYGNSPAKCASYGGLYEWGEAMGYAPGNNNDLTGARVQGICPAGFHIPSDLEWARFAYCTESGVAPTGPTPLAVFQDQSNFGWMGSTTAGVGPGAKLKQPYGSFAPPWTGSDAVGFGALPAGYRIDNTGAFVDEGSYATYWSATQGSAAARALHFVMDTASSSGRSGRNMTPKDYGMSVRCMKDYP